MGLSNLKRIYLLCNLKSHILNNRGEFMNNKIINFGNILINKNLDAILIKSKANKNT